MNDAQLSDAKNLRNALALAEGALEQVARTDVTSESDRARALGAGLGCSNGEILSLVRSLALVLLDCEVADARERFEAYPGEVDGFRQQSRRAGALEAWWEDRGAYGAFLSPEEEEEVSEFARMESWLRERFTWTPPGSDWRDGAFMIGTQDADNHRAFWVVPSDEDEGFVGLWSTVDEEEGLRVEGEELFMAMTLASLQANLAERGEG